MHDVQPELRAMFRTLHLSGMADNFADLAVKAASAHLTYESYLAEVVQCECAVREQRRIARLLRQSALPADKTFYTLHLERFPLNVQQQVEHLRSGVFTADAINVVAAGKPPNATCGCRRRWPGSIASPASSWTISATSNMSEMRWRCCLLC
jgi:DNA replication protein DnaC